MARSGWSAAIRSSNRIYEKSPSDPRCSPRIANHLRRCSTTESRLALAVERVFQQPARLAKAAIRYLEFIARLGELIDVGAPFIRTSINPCMAIRAGRLPFLLEAADRFHEFHSAFSVRAWHGQFDRIAELAEGGHCELSCR